MGSTSSRQETASGSDDKGCCSGRNRPIQDHFGNLRALAADWGKSYEHEPTVFLDRDLWDNRDEFNGRLEYYEHTSSTGYHRILFVRGLDKQSNQCARCELLLRDFRGTQKWFLQVRLAKWSPSRPNKIRKSSKEWNMTSLLFVVVKVAQNFKTYNVQSNNCRQFVKTICGKIQSDDPPQGLEIPG